MTLTLVVETGAGLSNANSYATSAEGDSYHEAHLHASSWTSATQVEKEAALVWATRLLDEQVQWYGYKTNFEQPLMWPRQGVLEKDGFNYYDNNEIPTWLKSATAELARYLLAEDRTGEYEGKGIKFMGAGPLQVSFDKGDVKSILPRSVISIVGSYGFINSSSVQFGRIARV